MQDQLSTTQPNKTVIIIGIIIAAAFPTVGIALLSGIHLTITESLFYSRFIFWGEVLFLWWYAKQYENQSLIIWKERESGIRFIVEWTFLLYLLSMAAFLLSAIPQLFGFHENNYIVHFMAKFMADKYFLAIFLSATAGFARRLFFGVIY